VLLIRCQLQHLSYAHTTYRLFDGEILNRYTETSAHSLVLLVEFIESENSVRKVEADKVSSALLPGPAQVLEGEFIILFIFRLFFNFRDIFFIEIDITLFNFFFEKFDLFTVFKHLS
jgi:hypothetical protein